MFNTSIDQFFSTPVVEIPIYVFTINLILSALLAVILGKLYVKYGNSISNRSLFSENFLLITMTTMLIISIVKSSLALSLGLVGALSIIRFRAAIKEPEELAYLFLAISIGLGLGANQTKITLLAFLIISCIIIIKKSYLKNTRTKSNLFITIISDKSDKIHTEDIINILRENCNTVELKRLDENSGSIEFTFLVNFNSMSEINKVRESFFQIDKDISFSLLDNSKLF